jgi:6-phosphofructokinase 1
VIKGAARIAISKGIGAYIIPNGYAGLYNLIDFEKLTLMNEERTDSVISSMAGSEAGHSRVKISRIDDPEKYQRIISGLRKFNIDGLIISGGDDTGSGF